MSRQVAGVETLKFSPDGKWLVISEAGQRVAEPIQLGDLTSKKWQALVIPANSYVERFTFTADGSRIALAVGSTVKVFETATAKMLLSTPLKGVYPEGIGLSRDGKVLAVQPGSWLYGGETKAQLITVADGEASPELTGPTVKARNIGFVPGGKTLWTLGDGRLREWDPAAAKWVREADVPLDDFYVPGPVWSPDGKRFAVYNRHTVALMDAKTWKPLHPEPLDAGPTDGIYGITVSHDGKTIATDGNDVHLWDAATGKLLAKVKATWGNESMLVFLPDSKSFVTIVDHHIPTEFDARTGKELRRFRVPDDMTKRVMFRNLRLSKDGKTLSAFGQAAFAKGKSASVEWDVASGEVSNVVAENNGRDRDLALLPPASRLPGEKVLRSATSSDGKFLATMGRTKLVVWNLATGRAVFETACDPNGNTIRARAIAFTPDNKRLITGHETHALVWDVSEATR